MNARDFDDDQRLEQAFAAAATAFPPPAGLQEAMRSRLFGEHIQEALRPTVVPRHVRRHRRWIVWAVAASLMIAGFLALNRSETKLVSVAYAELAAAFEKADEAEWVHFIEGPREEWISFQPYRHYSKWPDSISAWDRLANRQYHFDRVTNTLTVRHVGPPGNLEVLGSFSEMMRQKVAGLEEKGKHVRKGTETFNGKSATVYEVTGYRANEGGKYVKGKYFFDTQTDRFLGFEGSGTGWLSWLKFWMVVDYPAEGPQDVYALGVPRDAKILDKIREETPPREVLALVQKIDEAAAREPKQLRQISVRTYESFGRDSAPNFGIWVEVTCLKDGRLRRDRYGVRRTADYEQSLQDLATFRKEVVDRGMKGVEAWLKERKPVQILFGDTRSRRVTTYSLNREGLLARRPQVFTPYVFTLIAQDLARPWGRTSIEPDGTASLLTDRKGAWGTLVGFGSEQRSPGWQCYFNPQRDYVCERNERRYKDNRVDLTEVLEYGLTPDGHWFVKAARECTHSGRDKILVYNFRDDGREVEPRLFDESQIKASDLSAE